MGTSFNAPNSWESLLGAVTTMVATFLGAWYAFVLTEKAEQRRELLEAVQSANRVTFSLIRVRNNLAAVRAQIYMPFKSHPQRQYYIQPTSSLAATFKPHTITEVQPFFNAQDPLLVNELMNLEMEIVTTFEWMDRRSEVHIETQRRMDAASLRQDMVIPEEILVSVVGARLMSQLKDLTDQSIMGVDDIIGSCDKMIPRLNSALKQKYPGHQVLSMRAPAQEAAQADGSRSDQSAL